jgi:predicted esterase
MILGRAESTVSCTNEQVSSRSPPENVPKGPLEMTYRYVVFLLLITLSQACTFGAEDLLPLVRTGLERAGNNAAELRQALDEVPENHKEGMRFLIAYMPERDSKSLSANFLLENVRYAYVAWHEAPWRDRISKAMFLNNVLPYACINERRDDWRRDFFEKFKPLVADAESPGEAAVILNQKIFSMLQVRFSRQRVKADQSPYETIEAGTASCTGLSVLLVAACRAVGIPARFAGTPSWTNNRGNHSWVEVWDDGWHYMGAAEPAGDQLDRAWFSGRAKEARHEHRLHAIYATSFQPTAIKFPLAWDRSADYVYADNVTKRYTRELTSEHNPSASKNARPFDVEASLHAVAQLEQHLQCPVNDRPALAEQEFASVALTRQDAGHATRLLWLDHVQRIKRTRAEEMKAKCLTSGDLQMPFFYSVSGNKPKNGRSLYISLHGGGGAPKRVNDSQWENQKRLYQIPEGIYLAPRAPTNTWNLWHQGHIDGLLDRLIENLIVFEQVDPNRVYLLGYSAGGDGVYQLAPRMADRFAAASMMAGHPNDASPLGLRNLPFSIHVGENDGAYNRNQVARSWGEQLDALQKEDPEGYIHWTKIYAGKGHWLDREDAAALQWMAKYARDPLPKRVVWRQQKHRRFYWLAAKEAQPGNVVRANLQGQVIELQSGQSSQVIIRANDRLLNLDEIVTVTSKGKENFKGRMTRSIGTIAKTLSERGDPAAIFSAEVNVTSAE